MGQLSLILIYKTQITIKGILLRKGTLSLMAFRLERWVILERAIKLMALSQVRGIWILRWKRLQLLKNFLLFKISGLPLVNVALGQETEGITQMAKRWAIRSRVNQLGLI